MTISSERKTEMNVNRLFWIRAALIIICVAGVTWGLYKAFAMTIPSRGMGQGHDMPGHSMPDPTMPGMDGNSGAAVPVGHLMGMPLSAMPEMFVAAGALALIMLLPGRTATARTPRVTQRGSGSRIQFVICAVALSIDVSKTSSLGFVIPGMRAEYGISSSVASLLAVAGLTGTMMGATAVRALAAKVDRRDVYLISALGFAVTSSCGMMPNFAGNVVMCFLMGMSVGGLAPMLVATIREASPAGSSGGLVVSVSLIATAAGYFVASGAAAWLEPRFGWRAIWLIGAPTGILLLLATPLFVGGPMRVPTATTPANEPSAFGKIRTIVPIRLQYGFAMMTGVVAFGVTTWTPTLARNGVTPESSNLMLLGVSAVLIPMAVLLGWIYTRFGAAKMTAGLAFGMTIVLVGLLGAQSGTAPVWLAAAALAATLFCVNAMSAVLMPIAANSVAVNRTRMAATVSIFNRFGGLMGPLILAALVTSQPRVLGAIAVMALACLLLALRVGWAIRSQDETLLPRTESVSGKAEEEV